MNICINTLHKGDNDDDDDDDDDDDNNNNNNVMLLYGVTQNLRNQRNTALTTPFPYNYTQNTDHSFKTLAFY